MARLAPLYRSTGLICAIALAGCGATPPVLHGDSRPPILIEVRDGDAVTVHVPACAGQRDFEVGVSLYAPEASRAVEYGAPTIDTDSVVVMNLSPSAIMEMDLTGDLPLLDSSVPYAEIDTLSGAGDFFVFSEDSYSAFELVELEQLAPGAWLFEASDEASFAPTTTAAGLSLVEGWCDEGERRN